MSLTVWPRSFRRRTSRRPRVSSGGCGVGEHRVPDPPASRCSRDPKRRPCSCDCGPGEGGACGPGRARARGRAAGAQPGGAGGGSDD